MDVSIIVPVYNTELYLKQCMDSLVNQKTKYKYEIIAINDGSTDASLSILKQYQSKIIIIDKKNSGPGDSRNIGIEKASGEYLLFVDSDDYVSEFFVEKMVSAIKKNRASIAICDFYRVNNETLIRVDKGKEKIYDKGQFSEPLCMEFHSCNKIFKKELIKKNPYPVGMFFEDVVTISKAILDAEKIVKIDEALYYYRIVSTSTTNNVSSVSYDLLKATEMIEPYFLKNGYKAEIEYLYVNQILVDLCIKILKSNCDNKVLRLKKIKSDILSKYPKCFNNKFIKKEKIMKKLYLKCFKHNFYFIMLFMFRK